VDPCEPGKPAYIFKFGKHKGKPIEEVPNNYLAWLMKTDWFEKNYGKNMVSLIENELRYRYNFDIVIEDDEHAY